MTNRNERITIAAETMEISKQRKYTPEERMEEIKATMAMEGLELDEKEIRVLREYQMSKNKEGIRQQLLREYLED